jgi:hypothetical protein
MISKRDQSQAQTAADDLVDCPEKGGVFPAAEDVACGVGCGVGPLEGAGDSAGSGRLKFMVRRVVSRLC